MFSKKTIPALNPQKLKLTVKGKSTIRREIKVRFY